jgi:hypothetical protein
VRGEDGDPGPLADHPELVDGVGPLQVTGHEQRSVPLLLQPQPELAGQGGLAGALQTREQHHRRRGLGQLQPPGLPAEHGDQFVVDDLHDLLRRVQRLGHLGRQRPLPDGAGELADHGQRDVGVEQGAPDLADGRVDIGLGQPALAAQVLERRGEAIGQRREHVGILASGESVGAAQRRLRRRGRGPRPVPA